MLYLDNPLDRADHLRKQSQKIDELWSQAGSQLIPYCDGQFWFTPESNKTSNSSAATPGELVTLPTQHHEGPSTHRVFLGLRDNQAWFALDYSSHHARSSLPLPTQAQLHSLRALGPLLSAQEGAILAYTQAILHWHQHSKFCQNCGNENELKSAGHVRCCSNALCGKETFPRTDAAVIMLIIDDRDKSTERALLGRSALWPKGVFSTLAGFVEPGETLEDAVRREVFEEAGIRVGEVTYQASQPWPFPQSMMLGFSAYATSYDITVNHDELSDAGWFSKSDLAEFGDWGDEQFALQLPRPDSISRYLINSWLHDSQDK